eukprot:4389067-Karenia_brevis.AAC.1
MGNNTSTIITTPPPYLNDTQAQPLTLKINQRFYNYHYKKATPTMQGFMELLLRLRFAPAPNGAAGITWIELLLLAMAASPNKKITELPRSAVSVPTIGAQLRRFQQQ